MATTWDIWIIPSFQICSYGLHVEHISCVITNCGQHINSSLGLAGGKHYQKITIPIFRLVLQNFAILGYFPYILFYRYIFSLLSSRFVVIAVCDSISVQGTIVISIRGIVNWCRVVISNDKSTWWVPSLSVYDFKYIQALPFGLFEFEDL